MASANELKTDAEPLTATCGRYRIDAVIGTGGMGRVYRAFDPLLRRPVALKVLHSQAPDTLRRFLNEARAQARIDHANVCKVYEVGEVDEKPFLALQLVEGSTLKSAARRMTLDQRVHALRDVAEGVHAAHRLGLVHRDLKPTNVLVETREDGTIHPYVVDFGLVRDLEGPGLTATAEAVGTPSYMAPEQVTGERSQIDRRTDVYGLGAIFYELLTGRPPFSGPSGVATMFDVLDRSPLAPRRVAPGTPEDLETIALKCLEKEPHRRYDSARALADELTRYLDGEAIEARRSGPVERLLRRARRHRLVTAAALSTMAALALAFAIAVRARLRVSEESRLAQAFGRDLAETEMLLRLAHLSPLHDVGPESAQARNRLNALSERALRLGEVASLPAAAALGKGALALGDMQAAQTHLERAWAGGQQGPDVAHALGLTYGRLYQREMEVVESIKDRAYREARRAAAESRFLARALELLTRSRGSEVTVAEQLEAQIAFYEKRLDVALTKAKEAGLRRPWSHESRLLLAEVHLEKAKAAIGRGRIEEAEASFDRAADAAREATTIGRSDPATYLALAVVENKRMEMLVFSRGGDVAGIRRRALDALDQALTANPAHVPAWEERAAILVRSAFAGLQLGQDVAAELTAAEKAAHRAVSLNPGSFRGQMMLGHVHAFRADLRPGWGEDPLLDLDTAVESHKKATDIRPEYAPAFNNLGSALKTRAQYELERGRDPGPLLSQAEEAFEVSLRLNPGNALALTNRGTAYVVAAMWKAETDTDLTGIVERANELFERAAALVPAYETPWRNLGGVAYVRALARFRAGEDPRPLLERAEERLLRSVALSPGGYMARLDLAVCKRLRADWEMTTGGNPRHLLGAALIHLEEAESRGASHVVASVLKASCRTRLARYQLKTDRSAETEIQSAHADLRRARALKRSDPTVPLGEAELAAVEALHQARIGRSPIRIVEAGLCVADTALSENPRTGDLLAAAAELCLQRAAWELRTGANAHESVAMGLGYLDRLMALNPGRVDAHALERSLRLVGAGAANAVGRRPSERGR